MLRTWSSTRRRPGSSGWWTRARTAPCSTRATRRSECTPLAPGRTAPGPRATLGTWAAAPAGPPSASWAARTRAHCTSNVQYSYWTYFLQWGYKQSGSGDLVQGRGHSIGGRIQSKVMQHGYTKLDCFECLKYYCIMYILHKFKTFLFLNILEN